MPEARVAFFISNMNIKLIVFELILCMCQIKRTIAKFIIPMWQVVATTLASKKLKSEKVIPNKVLSKKIPNWNMPSTIQVMQMIQIVSYIGHLSLTPV